MVKYGGLKVSKEEFELRPRKTKSLQGKKPYRQKVCLWYVVISSG